MRLWSLHPRFLDAKGIVACWREALLAQAVLAGRTKGYAQHPQLVRFRAAEEPDACIGAYLRGVAEEATVRGYRFDRSRIDRVDASPASLPVTIGQLDYEWQHLGRKLTQRSPEHATIWREQSPEPHPLFTPVPGDVEEWERITNAEPARRAPSPRP